MLKYGKFVFYLFILFVIMSSFLYIIDQERKTDIIASQNTLVNKATILFENILLIRRWNSEHGNVYVKQHGDLKPNKYLKDNVIYSDKNETLIKINPAWMTRQLSELAMQDRKYSYKITSLKLTNPGNKADEFEHEALLFFEDNKEVPYYYNINHKDNKFDFIGSLKAEESCIKCHSGYSVGDIRGGIRISIPLNDHLKSIQEIKYRTNKTMLVIIVSISLLFIILFWLTNLIYKWQKNEKSLNEDNILLNKQVEDEIKKNRDKDRLLYKQSKNAQMGEMISMIAHQWRQPLNAISAAAIKLDFKQELGEVKDEDIIQTSKFIQNETQEMSQIINDFMNFFKSDNDKITFTLTSVFDDVNKIISSQFKIRNIILHNLIEDGVEIYGHKKELVHVLLNIVSNARDAFESREQSLQEISMEASKVDHSIEINICDNAGGMPKDVVDKIFNPYFTTKEQGKGTGIGLYMVKEMIEKDFSGTVNVKSYETVGTCLNIIIPIKKDESSPK